MTGGREPKSTRPIISVNALDFRNADDEFEWQGTVRDLRGRLGPVAFDAQWSSGQAATTAEALRCCG
ncbi:hypothetical protein ACIBHX_34775 [Nonomuraea sp. NPDC050536]|uniref:hypothetical protein n=1 Tax=Nonomuraea sp. NPDC050536 TaxID=3364366 RepID=UPI0037CC1DED